MVVEMPSDVYDVVEVEQKFVEFQKTFGKSYSDVDEKQRRFAVFQENLKDIVERNSKRQNEQSALFGIY